MVTDAGVNTILMLPSTHVQLETTADAMASRDLAGLGGAAFFPDGSVVWFQFQIRFSEAQSAWDWVGDDMQKHRSSLRSTRYGIALILVFHGYADLSCATRPLTTAQQTQLHLKVWL